MFSKQKATSLGMLVQQSEAQAAAKPRRLQGAKAREEDLRKRTVNLTPDLDRRLQEMVEEARGAYGRRANASSVLRALLACAEVDPQLRERVLAAIGSEINSRSVLWGRR